MGPECTGKIRICVELDKKDEIVPGGIFKTSSIFLERIKDEATKKALTGIKKDDKVILDAQKLSDNTTDLAAMLGIEKSAAEKLTSKIIRSIKGMNATVLLGMPGYIYLSQARLLPETETLSLRPVRLYHASKPLPLT